MFKAIMKTYLLVTAIIFACFGKEELFIATTGNDGFDGTIDRPFRSLAAAQARIRQIIQSSGLPDEGITVWIRGGRYPHTTTLILTNEDSGESGKPIVFSAYEDETVIFDGRKDIGSSGFALVTDAATKGRLHTNAQNTVYVKTISDTSMISLLSNMETQISFNDNMMYLGRYPNIGFAHVSNVVTDQTSTGQGTYTNPVGASIALRETVNNAKWNAELNRIQKSTIKGYVSADWYKEELRIHSVNTNGVIRLVDGAKYGFGGASAVERCYIRNMLCEIDEPGEWYFDDIEKKFYLWPQGDINSTTHIGIWAGPTLFEINASYIQIKKLIVQCLGNGKVGDGGVNIPSGSNNLIAGCTFRFIAAPSTAFNITQNATNSGALSCDIFDGGGSRCYGGKYGLNEIIPANNYVRNCHYTQVYSRDFYGKATALNGAGNQFINNLLHNVNGQPLTYEGVDHRFELNEVFNVGVEEGDGGAFYTGANVWSYGNIVKHNFMHHIICIPSLIGRAAFYSDDHDGGETYLENVCYKAGSEVIKINCGAGHTIQRNVVMSGLFGVRVLGSDASYLRDYNTALDLLKNDPNSTAKNNYLGRAEKIFGDAIDNATGVLNAAWRDSFWPTRYLYLKNAMILKLGMYPNENRVYDNLFYGNSTNFSIPSYSSERNSTTIALSIFVDPDVLNFKFREPRPAYAPDIPFEKIGLYVDEYRKTIPDKDAYRHIIKDHYASYTSHASGESYNPATINARMYFNTGDLIVNQLAEPSVKILTPVNGVTFNEPADIYVEAIHTGKFDEAACYMDDQFEVSDTTAPYSFVIEEVERGNHTIIIEAIDSNGTVYESEEITVTVLPPASIITEPDTDDLPDITDNTVEEDLVIQKTPDKTITNKSIEPDKSESLPEPDGEKPFSPVYIINTVNNSPHYKNISSVDSFNTSTASAEAEPVQYAYAETKPLKINPVKQPGIEQNRFIKPEKEEKTVLTEVDELDESLLEDNINSKTLSVNLEIDKEAPKEPPAVLPESKKRRRTPVIGAILATVLVSFGAMVMIKDQ